MNKSDSNLAENKLTAQVLQQTYESEDTDGQNPRANPVIQGNRMAPHTFFPNSMEDGHEIETPSKSSHASDKFSLNQRPEDKIKSNAEQGASSWNEKDGLGK